MTTITETRTVYAPWLRRAIAFILDLMVPTTISLVGMAVGGAIGGTTGTRVTYGFYAVAILVNFWNKCFRLGRTGQSWGKQIMNLSLVWENSKRPIGWFMAFVREFAHTADMITLGIGWLFPLWDRKRQTLGDKIMKTVAVDGKIDPALHR